MQLKRLALALVIALMMLLSVALVSGGQSVFAQDPGGSGGAPGEPGGGGSGASPGGSGGAPGQDGGSGSGAGTPPDLPI